MTSGNGVGAANRPFSQQDVDSILAIMDNMPLQNMKVARELQSLQARFVNFCSGALAERVAKVPAKGAKVPAEVNPAS